MTAFAELGRLARASRHPAVWAAPMAAFVTLALPDCCLDGRHVTGFRDGRLRIRLPRRAVSLGGR
jgi:hypothetical protein